MDQLIIFSIYLFILSFVFSLVVRVAKGLAMKDDGSVMALLANTMLWPFLLLSGYLLAILLGVGKILLDINDWTKYVPYIVFALFGAFLYVFFVKPGHNTKKRELDPEVAEKINGVANEVHGILEKAWEKEDCPKDAIGDLEDAKRKFDFDANTVFFYAVAERGGLDEKAKALKEALEGGKAIPEEKYMQLARQAYTLMNLQPALGLSILLRTLSDCDFSLGMEYHNALIKLCDIIDDYYGSEYPWEHTSGVRNNLRVDIERKLDEMEREYDNFVEYIPET